MEQVMAAVNRVRQSQFIPGGVVGLVRPGPDPGAPLTDVLPFGVVDVRTGTPADARTGFEIGSLSKLFTAAVLASAGTDPAFSNGLDTELRQLAPTSVPSWNGHQITIKDLVTHRSGLPRMPPGGPHTAVDRATYQPAELWAALAESRLQSCPGWSWLYSNFGFGILGILLAELSGRSFADLVDERVCRPLGLKTTVLEPSSADSTPTWSRWLHRSAAVAPDGHAPTLATGYRTDSTAAHPVTAPTWNNTGAMAGSGGLVSTGQDMTTFLAAAIGYGASPVTPALTQIRRYIPPRGGPDQPQMAMAWQFRPTRQCGPVLFKNGGTSGMHCAMAVLPPEAGRGTGFGSIVLTNGPDHVDDLAVELLTTITR